MKLRKIHITLFGQSGTLFCVNADEPTQENLRGLLSLMQHADDDDGEDWKAGGERLPNLVRLQDADGAEVWLKTRAIQSVVFSPEFEKPNPADKTGDQPSPPPRRSA